MSAPRTSRGFFKSMFRAVLKVLFRVRLDGNAAEFDNDRTLIVANHESFLDGLLLAAFLPSTRRSWCTLRSRRAHSSAGCFGSYRISWSTRPVRWPSNSSCGSSKPARPW